MRTPTDVHNHDNQNSATGVNTESKEDRELNAFLSVAGTDVPVAQDLGCDCGCEFFFDDDDDL
jgi:hypothetical protein